MTKELPPISRRTVIGLLSLLLRLMSLAGKLALSLFMGKFFALSELGSYGLAFGAVMLAIVVFGFRVDYIVSREILGMEIEKQRRVGTEVALLFLGSFVFAAPFVLAGLVVFAEGEDFLLLVLIYLLCGVEAYANFLYTVTIALKRPALANALFFVRAGLWTIPAMGISYFDPAHRTVEFVIGCWLAGVTLSVAINMWLMRRQLIRLPRLGDFRLRRVLPLCRAALLVWIGSVAITMGGYLDRFVLASFLTLDDVGVATFYTSFTAAALTLVQSATTSVTFPVLIEHYDAGRTEAYRGELRRTALMAAGTALVISIALAAVMPLFGKISGKPELEAAYPVFILLLVGTLVRTHAETLYYGLFVQRQHRAIWLGNIMFLAASLVSSVVFIWAFGLVGLGVSAILSAIVILVWRSSALRIAR